ncbi:MAG TPA: maleylpyruvate isomerase family mycothiol-dependent enzyme [Acidimicrobiia bacterium]|nr:maleylpyruvate isomerase family mycothiol-dependent enzyme [Acidimicrobiia bacterium]
MPSDSELIDLLDAVWSSLADLGSGLTEADWKTPTDVPGWSVQDNLAHITSMERRLLGLPEPDHELPADLPHVKNEIGRVNELFVDARRASPGADVLAEFREVTAARLEQLRGYGPDDFAAPSWTPVGQGTVRDLLPFRVFDSWIHEQDMRRAVARPGDVDTPVAANALERIVASMPFVVGKRVAPPDGTTVHFGIGGPLARTFTIAVDGGRARLVDELAAAPTATVATDSETFVRLTCGRAEPGAMLDSGAVHLGGDAALGRRVVEHLNFLF